MAFAVPSAAQPANGGLLQQAGQAYAQGDYGQALALYDSVNTQYTSAGLLFNIGNCYSKLNDVPHAILYYERALRLSPGAEDIQANLDLERTKVVDRLNQLPGFTLGSAWDRLLGGSDVDQWARISLWACGLMALAAIGALLFRARAARRIGGMLAALGLLATVVSSALAAYRVHEVQRSSEAIILQPSVEVLGEPRQGSTRLFMLHLGTKVGVSAMQGDWREVRLPNGAVGWLPATSVITI